MKTWEDVQRRALHDPYLRAAVTYADSGRCTREQALIVAALALSDSREQCRDELVECMKRLPARTWAPGERLADALERDRTSERGDTYTPTVITGEKP